MGEWLRGGPGQGGEVRKEKPSIPGQRKNIKTHVEAGTSIVPAKQPTSSSSSFKYPDLIILIQANVRPGADPSEATFGAASERREPGRREVSAFLAGRSTSECGTGKGREY